MKSSMATLMVAVLVGAQPLSAQIGQEVAAPPGAVVPRPQTPEQREVAPRTQERTHVVRRGDTLWGLAGHYYRNPFTWPTIFNANRGVVEDPHWIYPEEVLVIPGLPTAIAEGPPSAPGRITPIRDEPLVPERRTRFYREGQVAGDLGIIDDEIVRAGVQPGEHYASPWLANPARLPLIGVVMGVVGAPPGTSERDLLVHPFDDVYVEYRGTTRPRAGERLMVVDVLREFDDGADLFVMRPAGILTVRESGGQTMTARLTEHWAPFTRGARVLPLEPFPPIVGIAAPVSDGPVGRVVGFMIEQSLYGTTDYGFLDMGENQVQVGDVVMVYRLPRSGDTLLPPEPVAFVKIVRVGPTGSTFRVTKVMQRRLESGLPAQLVSRIP